jgi:hypothetical protein
MRDIDQRAANRRRIFLHDTAIWHRADWPSLSYTASIQRCPEDTPPAVAAVDATEE